MARYSLVILLVVLVITGIAVNVKPAHAQQGVTWRSEFFNNPYLSGNPVVTRNDSAVAFNWGAGSPGANIGADNFSGRISSDVYFEAGTYRFYILADDVVNLYVDFRSYINTWAQPRPGQLLTVDVPLQAGRWHIQIDYRENSGDAYLFVSWANLAGNPTGPSFHVPSTPVSVPFPTGGTWAGQYYNNTGLTGSPAITVSEGTPSHNWGGNAPFAGVTPDNFSARWSTSQFVEGGTYQFSVRADDGVRLFVDGVRHIDQWHNATNQVYTATLNLPAGNRNIVVEYYEAGGLAFLEYNMARVNVNNNPVPATPTGPVAIVTSSTLNVRVGPGTNHAIVLNVRRGESYPVLFRSQDGGWWQIRVNNGTGWVSGAYVSVTNGQNVPTATVSTPTHLVGTGLSLQARLNVNVRIGPGTTYGIVNRIPRGISAQIIARNSSSTWCQVSYNGTVGWVSGQYVILPRGINMASIPIA